MNGVARKRIARLNADGSLDTSFDPGAGANGWVGDVAMQADGKVLICGVFSTVDNVARNRIARLNADGSLDTSFDPGTGANSAVYAVSVQADGKVLIGGAFATVDGAVRDRIARLNADGTLDTSYDPGTGTDGNVWAIQLQVDGKALIGGEFTTVDGTGRNRIARLNGDGSLDVGLDSGTGASNVVQAVVLQPDGKVLVGGYFTTVDGTGRNQIARLNANGSVDTLFDPGTGANGTVYAVALQTDDKVLIGGSFTRVDGTGRNRVARLSVDGSLDWAWTLALGPTTRSRPWRSRPTARSSSAAISPRWTARPVTASPSSTPTARWTQTLTPAPALTTRCGPWRSSPTARCSSVVVSPGRR